MCHLFRQLFILFFSYLFTSINMSSFGWTGVAVPPPHIYPSPIATPPLCNHMCFFICLIKTDAVVYNMHPPSLDKKASFIMNLLHIGSWLIILESFLFSYCGWVCLSHRTCYTRVPHEHAVHVPSLRDNILHFIAVTVHFHRIICNLHMWSYKESTKKNLSLPGESV